jgi:predicted metallopeptidase
MSVLEISGYGYRKRTCEDVASWFLNKFFPRHKIYVEIVHRGLRREGVYGWCDVLGETYRPREFIIELNTHMHEELYIKTLLHELTHLRQWVVGSLRFRYGKLCYSKEPVEKYEYWHQPHEIIARREEILLYQEYMKSKKPTSRCFVNRLCK